MDNNRDIIKHSTSKDTSKHLRPFKKGELRTREKGQKGGRRSTVKKKIAGKISNLKRKHTLTEKNIVDLIDILNDITCFKTFTEKELLELLLLKDKAISEAKTAHAGYKIQRDFIGMVLQVGELFHAKDRFVVNVDQSNSGECNNFITQMIRLQNMSEEELRQTTREELQKQLGRPFTEEELKKLLE